MLPLLLVLPEREEFPGLDGVVPVLGPFVPVLERGGARPRAVWLALVLGLVVLGRRVPPFMKTCPLPRENL